MQIAFLGILSISSGLCVGKIPAQMPCRTQLGLSPRTNGVCACPHSNFWAAFSAGGPHEKNSRHGVPANQNCWGDLPPQARECQGGPNLGSSVVRYRRHSLLANRPDAPLQDSRARGGRGERGQAGGGTPGPEAGERRARQATRDGGASLGGSSRQSSNESVSSSTQRGRGGEARTRSRVERGETTWGQLRTSSRLRGQTRVARSFLEVVEERHNLFL